MSGLLPFFNGELGLLSQYFKYTNNLSATYSYNLMVSLNMKFTLFCSVNLILELFFVLCSYPK